jgi:hypothetical protein
MDFRRIGGNGENVRAFMEIFLGKIEKKIKANIYEYFYQKSLQKLKKISQQIKTKIFF